MLCRVGREAERAFVVTICSDVSEENLIAACKDICVRSIECAAVAIDQSFCESRCRSGIRDNDSDCDPTTSQINACVSAVNAASCESLEEGDLPEACDICEEDGGTGGSGGGSGGATCEDLGDCCNELPGDAQAPCDMIVNDGNETLCGIALSNFQSAMICN